MKNNQTNETKKCKHCQIDIPAGAKICPNCKKKQSNGGRTALIIFGAILVIGIIGKMANGDDQNSKEANSDNTVTESTTPAQSNKPQATAKKEIVSISAEYKGGTDEGITINNESIITVNAQYSDGSSKIVSDWSVTNPSALIAEQTSTYEITYQNQACTLDIACSTVSAETYKSQCQQIAYAELARNPDSYKGQYVSFRGQIIQVQESGSDLICRINVTKGNYGLWNDTVLISYIYTDGESKFLNDDIVQLYGLYNGTYTYESVLGSNITVPQIQVKYMELSQ